MTKSPERLEWEAAKRQATLDAKKNRESIIRRLLLAGKRVYATPEALGLDRLAAKNKKRLRES